MFGTGAQISSKLCLVSATVRLSPTILDAGFIDEFFVGTGDINSATLPKQKSTIPDVPSIVPPSTGEAAPTAPAVNGSEDQELLDRKAEEEAERMKQAKAQAVEKLLEDHPLAKAQEELDAATQDEPEVSEPSTSTAALPTRSKTPPGEPPTTHRVHKPVLKNDDRELERVEAILSHVHQTFYQQVDRKKKETLDVKGKGRAMPLEDPDVAVS